VSQSSCEIALEQLTNEGLPTEQIAEIKSEKFKMSKQLESYSFVEMVYPSDANFLLVKCIDSADLYHWLKEKGIYVRLRKDAECAQCIRISIGTPDDNQRCMRKFSEYENTKMK
jgi:histidinol-phosphate aminotransferase